MATVFTDRQSAYPNRFKVTNDDGTTYFITLERADEPVVHGTALNAETFNGMQSDLEGEIASAVAAHSQNKSNPHGVTAAQINAVPTSRTVNGKALSGNITLTASDTGAAPSSHNHGAGSITSGTLSSDRLPTVPVTKGGTNATTPAGARANLGVPTITYGSAAPSGGSNGDIYFQYI